MNGDLGDISGAVGDAVTGAAIAAAVEPGTSATDDATDTVQSGTRCLNCGTALIGAHCHACGQKGHIHRTLSAIGHDLIHGVLHFDGKMWRTLPLLALKPGELTRRFIEGERAKFVSPMALFLFSVFLMFAVFQIAGISTPSQLPDNNVGAQIKTGREAVMADLAAAQERLAKAQPGTPEYNAAQTDIAGARQALAGLERAAVFDFKSNPDVKIFGIESLDNGIVKKWKQQPELMLYKMQNNSYKFSWLLIPLSIPFVWLLFFWKRHFRAYDHAVFVTYSLAFMSLLFLVLSVAGVAGAPVPLLLALGLLIPPAHIYKQLKYGYGLTRLSAAWRTIVLTNLIVFIVLTLFLWLLLLLGAM